MKIVVRDDFMDPVLYTEIAFYYEKYLKPLYDLGGYCFKKQLIDYLTQSNSSIYERKAEAIYGEMIERKLIHSVKIAHSCYLVLGFNTLKYFTLKDEEKDLSDIPSRNLSVTKLHKRPSDRVLLVSAIKYQNYLDHQYDHSKQRLLEDSKKAFTLIFSELSNTSSNYEKILRGEPVESSPMKVQQATKVHTTYHDLSKIFFTFSFSEDGEGIFITVHIIDISMREAPKMARHISKGLLDMGLSLSLSNEDCIRGIELQFHTITEEHKGYLAQVKKSLANYILHNIFGEKKNIAVTTNYRLYENLARILGEKDAKKCFVKEKHEEQLQGIKEKLTKKAQIKGGESYS